MRIVAHHPAPVRSVPRGKRSAVGGFVRVATAAEIPEVAPGAMERVRNVPGGAYELGLHDGALWRRVVVPLRVPEDTFHPRRSNLSAETLGDWLASPWPGSDALARGLAEAFSGTPLCAFWEEHVERPRESYLPRWVGRRSAGDAGTDGARPVHDDRDRAAGEAARYLRDDVRLCGGGVWVRAGLMASNSLGVERLESGWDQGITGCPPIRPDLRDAYRGTDYARGPGEQDRLSGFLSRLPDGVLDDADLHLHANALPRFAMALSTLAEGKRLDVPPAPDELRALDLRGRIGAVRPAERHAVAALALGHVDALAAAPWPQRAYADIRRVREMAGFVREHVLPRLLAGPAPSDEDVATLSALAP